jgi:hypothetical protein
MSQSVETQHDGYESREVAAIRRLRSLLGEWRIADAELARRMHRSQTWVSARLNLRTHTQVDDFDEFGRALGVPTAWLLGFSDERPTGQRIAAVPLFQAPDPANLRTRDYKDGSLMTRVEDVVTHVDFRRRRLASPTLLSVLAQ